MGKESLEERGKSGSKIQGSAGRENGTGSHTYTKKTLSSCVAQNMSIANRAKHTSSKEPVLSACRSSTWSETILPSDVTKFTICIWQPFIMHLKDITFRG